MYEVTVADGIRVATIHVVDCNQLKRASDRRGPYRTLIPS